MGLQDRFRRAPGGARRRGLRLVARRRARHAPALTAFLHRVGAADPSVCDRLVTEHYLETVTHLRGAAAHARCRRDIAAGGAHHVTLNRVLGERITGDTALIEFDSSIGGLAKR